MNSLSLLVYSLTFQRRFSASITEAGYVSRWSVLDNYQVWTSVLKVKLKLQYFGHLMQSADSLEKTPDDGKDWRQKEKRVTEDEHYQLNGHAAAAESLQSCPTLCDPIDGSPPGSPVSGILQARTLEWVAISLSNAWKWKVKVKSFSRVRPSATPWTAAYQAPLSMGFSRQEYWSGVPLPSLSGHEFEQTPGDSEGQGRLACCSSWGHKKSDMTQQWNNSINLASCSPNCERCCADSCVSHSHAPKTWTEPLFMPRPKWGGHSFRFKCWACRTGLEPRFYHSVFPACPGPWSCSRWGRAQLS